MSINGWMRLPENRTLPIDPWLLGAALLLMITGFVMITSASMDVAAEEFSGPFHFVMRHGFFIFISLLFAAGILLKCPIRVWEKYSGWLLGIGFVLLVLVLIPGIGHEVKGSRRWIRLGMLNMQSSEVAKFCMVMYVGGYLVRRLSEVRSSWKGIAKPVIPLAFFVFLLLMEPDYGTSVVMIGTVMGMIFLGGMRFGQFIMILIFALGLIAVLGIIQPYRVARFQNFQNPWSDPFGDGYQLTQAQIAFGRGEWFGTGLGNSVQKLFYLPEAHTDFIFSVLAEETGLVGAMLVVLVYVLLIARIYLIGRQAEKQQQFFMGYICYGFGFILAGQALINIGVNVGALPTKGITLPLFSYGGSSLLICSVMIAVVLRVDYELKCLRIAASHGNKQKEPSNAD